MSQPSEVTSTQFTSAMKGLHDQIEKVKLAIGSNSGSPNTQALLPMARPIQLSSLRDLLKDQTARFRSFQQAEAVQVAAERNSHLVAILPTGAGKSEIFHLNAFRERHDGLTTVVMVPLVKLRTQHAFTAAMRGMNAHQWPAASFGELMLCIFEMAASPQFINQLRNLHTEGKLARIVIDECHYLFAADLGFRSRMTSLSILGSIGVPLVLLTGTLPPTKVSDVLRMVGIDSAREVRAPTTRHNIQYAFQKVTLQKEVNPLDATAFAPYVVAALEAIFPTMDPPVISAYSEHQRVERKNEPKLKSKVVVFFQWTKLIDEVYKLRPNWTRVHSQMSTTDQNESIQNWGSKSEIMLSSSILGLGFHDPDIRGSFHWDLPRNLVDFAQESGRVGRDGRKGWSIVLWYRRPQRPIVDDWGKGILIDGADSGVCRRYMLDTFMDGRGTTCLTHGIETLLCDNCTRALEWASSSSLTEPQLARSLPMTPQPRQAKLEAMSFRALLDMLEFKCVACFLRGRALRGHNHIACNEVKDIPRQGEQTLKDIYKEWKGRFRIPSERNICYRCHLPQGPLWHAKSEGQKCYYSDTVSAVIFHARYVPDLHILMSDKGGWPTEDVDEMLPDWGVHIQHTGFLNETVMFEWLCDEVLKRHG